MADPTPLLRYGQHPDGKATEVGPETTFYLEIPTVGDLRVFLDLKHDGIVRTADLTIQARADVRANDDGERRHEATH